MWSAFIYTIFLYVVYAVRHLPLFRITNYWRGSAMGTALDFAISRSPVQILLESMLRNNLRQVVYTYVPVTKQYNLVPAKGW